MTMTDRDNDTQAPDRHNIAEHAKADAFADLVAQLVIDARADAVDACARWQAAERIAYLTGRFIATDRPVQGLDDLDLALGDDMVARADLAYAIDTLGLPSGPPWSDRNLTDR